MSQPRTEGTPGRLICTKNSGHAGVTSVNHEQLCEVCASPLEWVSYANFPESLRDHETPPRFPYNNDDDPAHPFTRVALLFPWFRDYMTDKEREGIGLVPWNYERFWDWARDRYGTASTTERMTLSFLYDLWNGDKDGPVPKFDLRDVALYDHANRAAIAQWAAWGCPSW